MRWLWVPLLMLTLACTPADQTNPAAGSGTPRPGPWSGTPVWSTEPSEGGARAAPQPRPGVFDASQEAADDYGFWVDYEMNQPADRLRDFETDTYPEGVLVCASLATGTTEKELEARLSGTKGWTGSGAAAIIKAAVTALCPQLNRGYQTHFDKNVESAKLALAAELPWTAGPPPTHEIGFFLKTACGYLQDADSADGLEQHLHSYRRGGLNHNGQAAPFVQRIANDAMLRRATHHVVFAGCPGYHQLLNAHWTMA